MLRLQFISVYDYTILKNCIACVNIDFFLSWCQRHNLVHISQKFFRSSCFTRIVTGSLDAAGQRAVLVKALYIVTLPAMQRNRNGFQDLNGLVCVYADFCIFFFGVFISVFQCHGLFPPYISCTLCIVNLNIKGFMDTGTCFLYRIEFSGFDHLCRNISDCGSLARACMNLFLRCFCSQFI